MANRSLPWWRGVGETSKERYSREERLSLLKITEDEFSLYGELFLKYRRRDTYAQQREDGSWPQRKFSWDDSLILRHLCGQTNIAIPFGAEVDQIVLDIDNHGDRPWAEVETTVRESAAAIPGEPIIYRSSESEGVRMIWFLKGPVSRPALREWAKTALQEAGVTVANGKCEVRLGGEPDRLPFGLHSMLLGSDTLDPLYDLDLRESLSKVEKHSQFCAISTPVLSSQIDIEKIEDSRGAYSQIVTACLENGLPPGITTNDCLQKMAWYGRVQQGLENDELKVFLKDWITNAHNGHSTRVNEGKIESVHKQIDRVVDRLKAKAGHSKSPIKAVGLNNREIQSLLAHPGNFKTMAGLFQVLCFAKSKLRSQWKTNKHLIEDKKRRRDEGGEERKIGTNKWGTVFSEKQDIPNGARFLSLYIDLGKELLRRMKVPNSANIANFIMELERMGVLRKKREAWADSHKVRQYWVNFPFDPIGESLSTNFDLALWNAVGYEGIRQRFTKYQAARIKEIMEDNETEAVA